ncbi:hypothetical protein M9Y10_045792 [Tritrichomonas musculus]|uniref:Caspase family p20 domain-containing protein n=1 Tax=Tritrichomonas musculus TaxID=1915356 RepID=A0ABR2JW95_9EUKA
MCDLNNTYIFVILGDYSLKDVDSINEKGITKYPNYSLTSYAILIKRLAIKYLRLSEDHIAILAKGAKKDFEINQILNSKRIIAQLGISNNDIYSTKVSQSEMNFIYFQKTSDMHDAIKNCLKGNKNAKIFLFLYDHGNKWSFASIPYLQLYFPFLEIPHNSLIIFNESCNSGSMIKAISDYFAVSEVLGRPDRSILLKDIIFLAKIAKILYPLGNSENLDEITNLSDKINSVFNCSQDKNLFKSLLSKVQKKEIGYFPEFDMVSFSDIINEFFEHYKEYPPNYNFVHEIISKGMKTIKDISKNLGCANNQLPTILHNLKEIDPNFMNVYQEHPNHYIITSAHVNGSSSTFSSIRIKESKKKIFAGSPTMGAFIIEALMASKLSGININNIKKRVYGNDEGFIREYGIEADIKKRKGHKKKIDYLRFYIDFWNSRIAQQNFIHDQNSMNDELDINEIMKTIDFYTVDYKSDPELQIKEIKIMKADPFNEKEKKEEEEKKEEGAKKKKVEKKDKKKKKDYFGVRLAKIQDNELYIFDDKHLEYNDYYSPFTSDDGDTNNNNNDSNNNKSDADNNSNNNNNDNDDNNTNIHKSSSGKLKCDSFLNRLPNPNEKINQKKIDQIKKENQLLNKLNFSRSFLLIFKYELKKITQDTEFPYSTNSIMVKPPYYIECMLLGWIEHFLPTFDIHHQLNELLSLFYGFMHTNHIKRKISRDIFYHCMNVADQVVTPLHYNKNACIQNRIRDDDDDDNGSSDDDDNDGDDDEYDDGEEA